MMILKPNRDNALDSPNLKWPRAIILTYVTYTIGFVLYAFFLGIFRNYDSVVAWMSVFTPAVELSSRLFPALKRIPEDLVQLGHADWGLPVQHVLLIGGLASYLLMLWIAADVLFVTKSAYDNVFPARPRSALVKAFLVSTFLLSIFALVLFFDRLPSSWRPTFAGSLPLSFLAFLLTQLVFSFFGAIVSARGLWLTYISNKQ